MFTYPVIGGASNPNAGLLSGLMAWYTIGDDGAVTIDSHNGYNMSNNGVTTTTGKKGNAGDFVAASGDYMSRNQSVFEAAEGTIAFWMKQPVAGSSQWLFHTGSTVSGDMDCWRAGTTGSNTSVSFRVANDTSPSVSSSFPYDAWNLIICLWSATQAWVSVNGGALNTPSSGTYPGITSTGTFTIGERSTSGQNFNGQIDEFALWNRILSSDERALIWNSGAGITYSDL